MLLCGQGVRGLFPKESCELQRSHHPCSHWDSVMPWSPVFPFYHRHRTPLCRPQVPVTPQLQRETQNPRQLFYRARPGQRPVGPWRSILTLQKQNNTSQRGFSRVADAGELPGVQTGFPGGFRGGWPVAFPCRWRGWGADQRCPVPQLVRCAQDGRQLAQFRD